MPTPRETAEAAREQALFARAEGHDVTAAAWEQYADACEARPNPDWDEHAGEEATWQAEAMAAIGHEDGLQQALDTTRAHMADPLCTDRSRWQLQRSIDNIEDKRGENERSEPGADSHPAWGDAWTPEQRDQYNQATDDAYELDRYEAAMLGAQNAVTRATATVDTWRQTQQLEHNYRDDDTSSSTRDDGDGYDY